MEGYEKEIPFFRKWYAEHRPEVILSAASWVPKYLEKEMQLHLPEDVGFVHLALPPGDKNYTGIDQRLDELGAAAIDLLGAMQHQHEYGLPRLPKIVVLEGSWVLGKSVRAAVR
jgi:LacI family transcriptional regulator